PLVRCRRVERTDRGEAVTQDQTTADTAVPELRWSAEQQDLLILRNGLPYVLYGRNEPAPPPWRYDLPADAVGLLPAGALGRSFVEQAKDCIEKTAQLDRLHAVIDQVRDRIMV